MQSGNSKQSTSGAIWLLNGRWDRSLAWDRLTEVNTSSQRVNSVYYFELKPDQADKALLKVTATPNSKQIRPTYA